MQFFTILSLAASALAYQVTFPTENAVRWSSRSRHCIGELNSALEMDLYWP
jgi:outer membrane protease